MSCEQRMKAEVFHLFAQLRPEIKRLINRYLDRRLLRRLDASDIVQSAYLDVQDRLSRFLSERPMEIRPWLFFLAKMKTLEINQQHLEAQKRAVTREVADASPLRHCCDSAASPSQAMSRKETRQHLLRAIDQLPEHYRRVIELRHMQNLSNQDTSRILAITPNAASKLYVRAVNALQSQLCA